VTGGFLGINDTSTAFSLSPNNKIERSAMAPPKLSTIKRNFNIEVILEEPVP